MKQAKKIKVKEPVRLRSKTIANGNQSLYLDCYTSGNKREYEFLKLYLIPEKTQSDKEANTETLRLANAIKAQKIVELQNTAHGFHVSGGKQKASIYDYLQKLADESFRTKPSDSSTARNYKALIALLKRFSGDKTTFKQVDKEFCLKFIEWLKTAENKAYPLGSSDTYTSGLLSQGSQWQFFTKLKTALNRAVIDDIIPANPCTQVQRSDMPKRATGNREYLTIDEVKQLIKTDCIKPIIKQAFLFSCFSGLRFSDVKNLKWSDIQTDNEGKRVIRYTQQKTKKDENLQVSDEAIKFIPEKGKSKDDDIIFSLPYNGTANGILRGWACAAGIKKRVTFHVGRHTNATLLLSLGVPIETVSKLLGHSDIQTTQIYAKVIDKNKRAAVSKLDGLTN
jgi:integrase